MKIKLTRKNHGTVLDILRKLMSKPFSLQHSWDSKMKEKEIEGSGYNVDLYRSATVSKHWNFSEKDSPLIHLDFQDDLNYLVLYEGDVIKILGGTKLIIQQTKTATIEILGHQNLTFIVKQIEAKEDELAQQEDLRRSEKAFYDSIDEDEYYIS